MAPERLFDKYLHIRWLESYQRHNFHGVMVVGLGRDRIADGVSTETLTMRPVTLGKLFRIAPEKQISHLFASSTVSSLDAVAPGEQT